MQTMEKMQTAKNEKIAKPKMDRKPNLLRPQLMQKLQKYKAFTDCKGYRKRKECKIFKGFENCNEC